MSARWTRLTLPKAIAAPAIIGLSMAIADEGNHLAGCAQLIDDGRLVLVAGNASAPCGRCGGCS